MLEVVPINTKDRHVVISTISIWTSIKSMVYTCVSDESVLMSDLPNTECCWRELSSEKSSAFCS